MDPLSILRECQRRKRPVTEEGDQLVFDGRYTCSKDVETSYKRTTGEGGHYTIGCLWYLLQNVTEDHGKYLLACKKAGIPAIARADRRDFLAYISGQTDSARNLDKTFVSQQAVPVGQATAKRPAEDEADAEAKRARVEGTGAGPADDGGAEVRSLSSTLTKEKVEELRAKRLKKKGTGIVSSDQAAVADVFNRARVYETRESVMRCEGTSFSGIIDILRSASKKANKDGESTDKAAPTKQPAYSRYNQPAEKEEGDEFNINFQGTFMKQDDYRPGMLLTSVTGKEKKAEPAAAPAAAKQPKKPRSSKTPIIIVPSSAGSSLVTIFNIKKLLEEGVFVPHREAQLAQGSKPTNVVIQRRRTTGTVPYRVVDNPASLTQDQWKRVIAVFVAGPEWQFKGYPLVEQGGIVNLFQKARGVHVHYDDQKLHDNIKQWNVLRLALNRSKRHLDATASRKFWEDLDSFARKNRTDLRI